METIIRKGDVIAYSLRNKDYISIQKETLANIRRYFSASRPEKADYSVDVALAEEKKKNPIIKIFSSFSLSWHRNGPKVFLPLVSLASLIATAVLSFSELLKLVSAAIGLPGGIAFSIAFLFAVDIGVYMLSYITTYEILMDNDGIIPFSEPFSIRMFLDRLLNMVTGHLPKKKIYTGQRLVYVLMATAIVLNISIVLSTQTDLTKLTPMDLFFENSQINTDVTCNPEMQTCGIRFTFSILASILVGFVAPILNHIWGKTTAKQVLQNNAAEAKADREYRAALKQHNTIKVQALQSSHPYYKSTYKEVLYDYVGRWLNDNGFPFVETNRSIIVEGKSLHKLALSGGQRSRLVQSDHLGNIIDWENDPDADTKVLSSGISLLSSVEEEPVGPVETKEEEKNNGSLADTKPIEPILAEPSPSKIEEETNKPQYVSTGDLTPKEQMEKVSTIETERGVVLSMRRYVNAHPEVVWDEKIYGKLTSVGRTLEELRKVSIAYISAVSRVKNKNLNQ